MADDQTCTTIHLQFSLPGDWGIHYIVASFMFFKTSTDRCTQTAVDRVAMATSGCRIAEHTLVLAVKQSFVFGHA